MENLGIEFISVFGMPPVEFVELAAALGCRHISAALQPSAFSIHKYPSYSLRDDPALRRQLIDAMAHQGVSISLGEGFAVQPGVDARESWRRDLEIMGELGIRRINSVALDRDFSRNVEHLGTLAEIAAGFGIETLLEFVPIFGIADIPAACAVVQQVGRPDLRILVDTMHVARSGATPEDLAALDPNLIGYIQLCDVPRVPKISSYLDEAVYERMAPGEGELPLFEMLSALPRDRIVGLEVPMRSEIEAGVSARERLGRCLDGARDLMARLDQRPAMARP